jgi:hypothetical protein
MLILIFLYKNLLIYNLNVWHNHITKIINNTTPYTTMARLPVDFTKIYDYIYKIDSRIGYLEKDATFIEKKLSAIESRRIEKFNDLKSEFSIVEAHISRVQKKIQECTLEIIRLGHDLRNSVKNPQLQDAKDAADSIPFTDFVTIKDLKRGLL